ncbi:MAG TPA: indole-3-glycerol phosphate synthase TrpC [Acidimicrobiales bacterium]|nr:indole-3-glycerol phosphate synthase TrpC [Acidimicrobiales bacterium]
MATYLDRIVAAHRASAALDRRPLEPLLEAARAVPSARPFCAALTAADRLAVIAEIKRRSPSRGELAPGLEAAELAERYQAGGAAALSVLTDAEFFGGSPADLGEARAACALPVLRKDFIVDARDVLDARLMGADAVLLIVAALDDAELVDLVAVAADVRIEALVEVHDEAEADRALSAGAGLVGVNQRDLSTFAVDRALARRLRPHLGPDVVAVAESGITGPEDAAELADAGYAAVLVGEALVTSRDPAGAVRALHQSPVRS